MMTGLTPFRFTMALLKWVAFVACGLFAVGIIWGLGGYASPFPDTEITHQKPYAAFVGGEYRVKADVSAYAWNDFPDKAKILSISLMPPPGVRNRFVSYVTPLKPGQRIRIVSAWRHFALVEFTKYYVVSVPDAGLPEDRQVDVKHGREGIPTGATIVDGRGKYLIPGMWDMHVHIGGYDEGGKVLPRLIAYGITGIRDMASPVDDKGSRLASRVTQVARRRAAPGA